MENGDSVPAGVDSVAEKVDLVAASWNGSKSGLSDSNSWASVRQTTWGATIGLGLSGATMLIASFANVSWIISVCCFIVYLLLQIADST